MTEAIMSLCAARNRLLHKHSRGQCLAKTKSITTRFVAGRAACFVSLLLAGTAYAQNQAAQQGESVENSIADRNLALRIRGEVQLTDSEMSLIDTDPNYARFPAKMYTAEAKLFQRDGSSFSASYSVWQNSQGLDSKLWQWRLRFPLQSSDFRDATETPPFVTVSDWNQKGTGDSPNVNYWYLGIDETTVKNLYMYFQYRNGTTDGALTDHQLYEYVTKKMSDRLQLGEQAAISRNVATGDLSPWYAGAFATIFLVKDLTSLRLNSMYYDSEDVTYQQYDAYLYQKIGMQSFFRLSYRYYHDNSDLISNSEGIMLKRYFSPRISAHLGYRFYNHSQDANLNTFFGGFNILL